MKYEERINNLLTVASWSEFPRIKIASAVFYKNRLKGIGVNSLRTHPLQKHYDLKYRKYETCGRLHAEFSAILDTGMDDLSGCTIYIARSLKNGSSGMCRPCPACLALIKQKNIKDMIYTTPEGICHEVIKGNQI